MPRRRTCAATATPLSSDINIIINIIKFVFSRTCAGKRHLKSRERGDRKGANGGKREGERSEQESVVPRQNKDSRRVGGHAPPQRHLKRSVGTTKTRFTGRKQNKRSEFCCLPVSICRPRQNKDSRRVGGHAPPQRHLERSAATTKVGANGGENARTSHAK